MPVPIDQDKVFKALADPARRLLLDKLHADNGQTLGQLCEHLDMSRQAVTKHLNVLAQAGIITRRREGRLRYCRLRPASLQGSLTWLARYRRLWNDRLDALEGLLAEELARQEEHPDARDH